MLYAALFMLVWVGYGVAARYEKYTWITTIGGGFLLALMITALAAGADLSKLFNNWVVALSMLVMALGLRNQADGDVRERN